MNPYALAMALLAITITSVGSSARAQPVTSVPGQTLQGVFTLVSPPVAADPTLHVFKRYAQCQVTNLSAQSVTLRRLQVYHAGSVRADATCAGPQAVLQPGQTCAVDWSLSSAPAGGFHPATHCRAVFVGTRAGAVAGTGWVTYQGFETNDAGLPSAVPLVRQLLALQLVDGLSLAP